MKMQFPRSVISILSVMFFTSSWSVANAQVKGIGTYVRGFGTSIGRLMAFSHGISGQVSVPKECNKIAGGVQAG